MSKDSRGVPAKKAVTQDSSPVAVSLRPSWAWGLASHFPGDPGNLTDTTSDRGAGQTWLDKISGVSKPLAQQLPDPLLSGGEC